MHRKLIQIKLKQSQCFQRFTVVFQRFDFGDSKQYQKVCLYKHIKMKYEIRNGQIPVVEGLNTIEGLSFVRDHSNKGRDKSPRPQNKRQSQQLSSGNHVESTGNGVRSSFGGRKSRETEIVMYDSAKPLRKSRKEGAEKQSTYQHTLMIESLVGSNPQQSEVIKYQSVEESNGGIYHELIKVLQLQNRNLKDQNHYFVKEYKKISKQNSVLRKHIQDMTQINGLNLEIEKLRNINKAYKTQVEELKYILLEEIVAIHQKFNMFMSQEEATLMYNELNDSIRKSSLLKMDQFNFAEEENLRDDGQFYIRTQSRMTLGDMLEIGENDDDEEKSPEKTRQSSDKENILNMSNFQFKGNQSPTQTTFSGYLRSSN